MTGASKILALPERGGRSDPCQDFLVDLAKCTKESWRWVEEATTHLWQSKRSNQEQIRRRDLTLSASLS